MDLGPSSVANPWIIRWHWGDCQWCCNVQVQCSSCGAYSPCVQLKFGEWPLSSAASPSVQTGNIPLCNEAIQRRVVAESETIRDIREVVEWAAGTAGGKDCIYEIFFALAAGFQVVEVCSPRTKPY